MQGEGIIDAIIFLGTQKSGSSRDALIAAERLGYFTCLFTNNLKQIHERISYPEVHLMQYCNLDDIDAVRETVSYLQHNDLNIRSIISFIDPYCGLAAMLAKEFNVGCFTPEALETMHNKLKTREILKELEYNPKYQVVNKKDYKENQYIRELFPAVVKYCGSNGSKDVYYCENMNAYLKNCDKLFADFPNGELLVEEYLNGDQFIVEVLVKDRKVHIAALVEQEIQYLNEHFIITGYNLIINYARSYFEKLKRAVISIISRLGLENGPCHLEMRHVNNEWKLVEINPRISGAGMNKLLSIGFGFNLVEETLKLALKEKFNISPRFTKNSFAEYVILEDKGILQRITGRAEVINSPGIEYTYVKPRRGTLLSPPTSLGNRYAYVIATGKSEEEAKENAKLAAKKIVFHIHKEP